MIHWYLNFSSYFNLNLSLGNFQSPWTRHNETCMIPGLENFQWRVTAGKTDFSYFSEELRNFKEYAEAKAHLHQDSIIQRAMAFLLQCNGIRQSQKFLETGRNHWEIHNIYHQSWGIFSLGRLIQVLIELIFPSP